MSIGTKVVLLLCAASIFSGFTCAHVRAQKAYAARLEEKTFTETIHKNDCLDNILEQYYNPKNEDCSWDDFRAIHYRLNAKVLNDGFQPGEKVTIVCRVLKA